MLIVSHIGRVNTVCNTPLLLRGFSWSPAQDVRCVEPGLLEKHLSALFERMVLLIALWCLRTVMVWGKYIPKLV